MRAIEITAPGGPEQLTVVQRPVPAPGPGEVLIRVAAAGINRADVLQRQGFYNPPPGATDIPGLEVAGTIVELGPPVDAAGDAGADSTSGAGADSRNAGSGNATQPAMPENTALADGRGSVWRTGTRVAALLSGGGYAEFVAVPAGQLLALPDDMPFTDAAALPEVLSTVYSNVFMDAGLQAGEWLLVHGGGSGIGTCAIQMAKELGAKVAVTVGSARKAAYCRDLGADAVINYHDEDFVERIGDITDGHGADVILDVVGAKYLQRNLKALATGGRLTIIGLQGGVKAEINLNALMTKRQKVMGATLRARPPQQKAAIIAAVRQHVWPLALDNRLKPIVHAVLPLGGAGYGQSLLEDGTSIGKVILDLTAADDPAQGTTDPSTSAAEA